MHNLDNPKKRELFNRAVENHHRACREVEEQYHEQRRRPGTLE